MAYDPNFFKSKLNALRNTNQKTNLIWKPVPGKQEVRVIPYKFAENPIDPFIVLKFHYNMNGKTYLSPSTFDRPDPIVEFSNKLKRGGSKEEWLQAKKLEPKSRYFALVLVRGEEKEGPKFWGFGKQVYDKFLEVMSDPDYGNIADLSTGRDVVVEFKTPDNTSSGKKFPETSILIKPIQKPAIDISDKEMMAKIGNQTNILTLFPEPTYDELKEALESHLNPEDDTDENPTVEESVIENLPSVAETVEHTPVAKPSTPKKSPPANVDAVASAFDEIFNK